jgi:hypothetical protein
VNVALTKATAARDGLHPPTSIRYEWARRTDNRNGLLPLNIVEKKPPVGAPPPAIALSNVNLSLGRGAARVHILKDITLDIGQGEAVGLVGPSGSGKSTLLMVIAGLERPDTGAVRVAGADLGALNEDGLARFRGRRVGIVFQSFHLIPTMTALENVAAPLELAGAADAFERADSVIIRRSSPAASSSGSQSPGRSRQTRRSWWPTSRPAILTRGPGGKSSISCSAGTWSGAPRSFSLRMIRRLLRAAAASCACVPAMPSLRRGWSR